MLNDNQLLVCFSDENLKINLYNNPVSNYLYTRYKHLKHIPLDFNNKDIFFNKSILDITTASEGLTEYARLVGVEVDISKLTDQLYLNYLHNIYEKNFNGNEKWLKFHESIHILEMLNDKNFLAFPPVISFEYRTLSGKLEKEFNREYYNFASTTVKKNQCFVKWQELGKTPYSYFINNEPNNINRLCELAKPWRILRVSFHVACDDINCLDSIDLESFNDWFAPYKSQWCKYWNISDWDVTEMFKVIPIGEIDNAEILVTNIKNNKLPLRVST